MIKRDFTDFEHEIINKIASYGVGEVISIHDFLEKTFFLKESGRSLIIQIKEQYAMFFLPVTIFENNSKQTEAINRFVELFSLINYLNSQGYIAIFKEGHQLKQQIYYVGSEFDNPRVENGKLILNSEGVYSIKPEEIKNKSGNIIYKGVEFKDNDLIIKNAIGKLFISDKIIALKETLNIPEKKNKKWGAFLFRTLCLMLLTSLLVLIYFVKKDINSFYESDTYLINEKIVNLTHKIESKIKYDSIKEAKLETSIIEEAKAKIVNEINNEIPKKKLITSYGIDISRWNGNILRHKLPDSIDFIICKATEGITFTDSKFKRNWEKIKELGLKRGAYHFYLVNDDPIMQAEHFWNHIKDMDSLDIAPVIDIERGSIKHNSTMDPITLQAGVLAFLNHLEKLSSITPIIYVNLDFANTYITHKIFSKYSLWIADYSSEDTPQIPTVWKDVGYTIWQKSSEYKIGAKAIDLDVYQKTE